MLMKGNPGCQDSLGGTSIVRFILCLATNRDASKQRLRNKIIASIQPNWPVIDSTTLRPTYTTARVKIRGCPMAIMTPNQIITKPFANIKVEITQRVRLPSSSARKDMFNTPKNSQTTALTKNMIPVHFNEVDFGYLPFEPPYIALRNTISFFLFKYNHFVVKKIYAGVNFSEARGLPDHG